MQVDKNGDIISNLVANFYRKFQDTEGLALFRCKVSEVEQNAKAIEDNHRNPTPEGDRQTEALRVPKPDNPESKQGYRFDPAKIDWESLKKVGITAETLKNTKDFDRVMRGYKSRNTYTVSGSIGGFYLKPTDVKLSFCQAKDGTVVPKLHGVQQDEKLLQRPYNGHEFSKQEYNPQIQISEKSQTKRLKIADSRKTKRPIIDKRTTPNKRHSNAIITL